MRLLATSTALGLLIAVGAVAPASADGNATVEATAMLLGGAAYAQIGPRGQGSRQRPVLLNMPANLPQGDTSLPPETDQPATNAEPAPSAPSAAEPATDAPSADEPQAEADEGTNTIRRSRATYDSDLGEPE